MIQKMICSLICLLLLAACASSQKNRIKPSELTNLVELRQPDISDSAPADIYLDSVEQGLYRDKPALLIHGSFPDGCTHLKSVDHELAENILILKIDAWRNPDLLCTQALVSFSYIYTALPENRFNRIDSVRYDGARYLLK
ncbi:MAG: hypothetical protein R3211_08120 [Balneolaceae bacterium]|nr:hypothetical protein [Balneolaceae bacterium]